MAEDKVGFAIDRGERGGKFSVTITLSNIKSQDQADIIASAFLRLLKEMSEDIVVKQYLDLPEPPKYGGTTH